MNASNNNLSSLESATGRKNELNVNFYTPSFKRYQRPPYIPAQCQLQQEKKMKCLPPDFLEAMSPKDDHHAMLVNLKIKKTKTNQI